MARETPPSDLVRPRVEPAFLVYPSLTCSNSWKKLKDPIATVTKPAIVQANAEPAAIVPPTMQMPQAAIPREIRYAAAVSVSQSMNRELLIWTIQGRVMLAAPEQGADLRFVALCGAIRHAGHQAAYRELPCADALLVRMGSDQSDIPD
jgi:hypothetical protein